LAHFDLYQQGSICAKTKGKFSNKIMICRICTMKTYTPPTMLEKPLDEDPTMRGACVQPKPKMLKVAQISPKPRVGSVTKGIRRAFLVEPEWSTSALAAWTHALPIHRGKISERDWHNHRRAIRRACERLCIRVGRSSSGSGRALLWRLKSTAADG
jgi:hypothetical protein